MGKLLQIILILAGGSMVAVADVLIKKISVSTVDFRAGLRHPLIFAVLALYTAQIFVFLYLFHKKAGLGLVGISTFTLYTIIVVASALFLFGEKISLLQGLGMLLPVVGVLLMNI